MSASALQKASAVTGCPIPDSQSQRRAREILGWNYLGPEAVRRGFGIPVPADQFAEIPYSEGTLRRCRDTHVLVAGSALSLSQICQLVSDRSGCLSSCRIGPFAEKNMSVRWYLLRKNPVPDSYTKTYDQQCFLLPKDEEVPYACEVAYMVILFWFTHGERLLPEVYVRCADSDSRGHHSYIGYFGANGFCVSHGPSVYRCDRVGFASSWKP